MTVCETVTLNCEKHGVYTGEAVTASLFGKSYNYKPACPVCEEEDKAAQEKTLFDFHEKEKIQRWRLMNIEKLFYDSGFDNFNAYNAQLRENLKVCGKFAGNPAGKLVMLGENGNGKTHLAISILKETGGVIYTAYEIGIMLRDCYNGNGSERELFEELCAAPLLVIDEVEKIKDSDAKQNWMSYVVGKRYNRMLPLIFIANCHVKNDCGEQTKPCPRCLEYHLENDILSRIIEDGIILKFNSDDYREKIRGMNKWNC